MYIRLSTILIVTATLAGASGEVAWEEFRTEVASRCEAELRVDPNVDEVKLSVDPFGSESFGIAIAEITASWGSARRVCILDRATGRVELSGEL